MVAQKKSLGIKICSACIVLGVGALVVWSAFAVTSFVHTHVVAGETNIELFSEMFFACKPVSARRSDRMAMLRIDDVQAYAWRNISRQMVDDAMRRDMPVVLSIIPKDIERDAVFYRYLRRIRCNAEFAVHGWDHQSRQEGYEEFAGISEQEAYQRVIRGKEVIERMSDERVVTFVPPNNMNTPEMRAAVRRAGIPVISSKGENYFDIDTSTFDFKKRELVPPETILNDCEHEFATSNLCVIMLHPQDFAQAGRFDERAYKDHYTRLLDMLGAQGVSVVRVKDI